MLLSRYKKIVNSIKLLLVLQFFSINICFPQSVNDTSIFIPHFKFSYSFQIPGGDLAKRFGNNSNISADFSLKTNSNWIIGLEGFFLFGDKVKESSIFDSLTVSEGELINKDGEYTTYVLSERGLYFGVNLGKLFPVWGPNPNSGIIVLAGVGFLQHKIKIENDGNMTPSISGDYKKGYDRLSNGLAAKIFVGYMYLGRTKLKNFFGGFEFSQAWTKNRRDFNFDTRVKDTKLRNDILYSFKIGWVLPLYVGKPQKFYTH